MFKSLDLSGLSGPSDHWSYPNSLPRSSHPARFGGKAHSGRRTHPGLWARLRRRARLGRRTRLGRRACLDHRAHSGRRTRLGHRARLGRRTHLDRRAYRVFGPVLVVGIVWVVGPVWIVESIRVLGSVWIVNLVCVIGPTRESRIWGWLRRISNSTYYESIWISTNLANWNPSKKCLHLKYFLISVSKQSISLQRNLNSSKKWIVSLNYSIQTHS